MSDYEPETQSDMGGAPPVDPPQLELDNPPPGWPKVVGIMSIVIGSIALLCTGASIPLNIMQLNQMKADSPPDGLPEFMQTGALDIALGAVGVIAVVLLIVAGGATAARARIGRPLHLIYAFVELALLVVAFLMAFENASLMQQWAADHQSWIDSNKQNPLAMTAQMPSFVMWLPVAVIGTPFAIFSLFLIFWFGALGKQPEVGKPDYI